MTKKVSVKKVFKTNPITALKAFSDPRVLAGWWGVERTFGIRMFFMI
jgi:hypothetical protein